MTKTYEQAIKTPENGWKYANEEQTVAAAAQGFAMKLCINPDVVYNWIFSAYNGDWQTAGQELHKAESPLICVGAILDGYKVSEY